MTAVARKSFVGVLLAFGIGVQLLEISGRWDQTFQDANDEAGIVAIVLCVGVALTASRMLLACVRFTRRVLRRLDVRLSAALSRGHLSLTLLPIPGSPPTALRI